MGYVKTLTLEPAKVTDEQVEGLRKAGWTDDQIAEASFDSALFALQPDGGGVRIGLRGPRVVSRRTSG
jgi:hypothetical protein